MSLSEPLAIELGTGHAARSLERLLGFTEYEPHRRCCVPVQLTREGICGLHASSKMHAHGQAVHHKVQDAACG